MDHFKTGEKVYVKPSFFKGDMTAIPHYRLVRPVEEADLDNMILSAQEKESLRNNISAHKMKPFMVEYSSYISKDSLIKHKTSCYRCISTA